jgi:hypothetical protein
MPGSDLAAEILQVFGRQTVLKMVEFDELAITELHPEMLSASIPEARNREGL